MMMMMMMMMMMIQPTLKLKNRKKKKSWGDLRMRTIKSLNWPRSTFYVMYKQGRYSIKLDISRQPINSSCVLQPKDATLHKRKQEIFSPAL